MKENGWKELKQTSFVYRNDGYVLVMVKDHPYANKMGFESLSSHFRLPLGVAVAQQILALLTDVRLIQWQQKI